MFTSQGWTCLYKTIEAKSGLPARAARRLQWRSMNGIYNNKQLARAVTSKQEQSLQCKHVLTDKEN